MAAVGMFANVNIAAGLTVFFTTLVGGALFFFTLFSFNATVISGGFVVTALVALVVFGKMYRHTARLPPKDRRSAAAAGWWAISPTEISKQPGFGRLPIPHHGLRRHV